MLKIFRVILTVNVSKWRRTNERVVFEATMFTGTFGPLLWEKFFPVRDSRQTVETDTLWLSKRMEKQSGIYLGKCRVFARCS